MQVADWELSLPAMTPALVGESCRATRGDPAVPRFLAE
jgi:hypothetical protein